MRLARLFIGLPILRHELADDGIGVSELSGFKKRIESRASSSHARIYMISRLYKSTQSRLSPCLWLEFHLGEAAKGAEYTKGKTVVVKPSFHQPVPAL